MSSESSSSLKTYVAIFVALLVLTGLTVAVAYQDLGKLAAVVAVAIAVVKATLVGTYFMHLRSSSRLITLYAVSGVVFFGILVSITLSEVFSRPAMGSDPLPLNVR